MRHLPSNDRTPTYEGRPLVRPDDEVVDQGLGFDITTLMSRRRVLRVLRVLRALGLGAAAAGLAACASNSSTASSSAGATTTAASGTGLVEIPDETAGPYPGDGSNGQNVLTESGIVRRDIRSSFGDASGTAEGVPTTIQLDITDLANGGTPFATVTGDVTSGYTIALTAAVDTTTTPTAGSAPAGGPGGPPPSR